jgi:hypothetical protein
MIKAIRAAIKYKELLPIAIDFIVFAQEATKDGKLLDTERGTVMRHMWAIIKAAEKLNAGKINSTSDNSTVRGGKKAKVPGR